MKIQLIGGKLTVNRSRQEELPADAVTRYTGGIRKQGNPQTSCLRKVIENARHTRGSRNTDRTSCCHHHPVHQLSHHHRLHLTT